MGKTPNFKDTKYIIDELNCIKGGFLKLFCFVLCPQVLFNQFKYFYNLYFLLLACSQFIKELRLGALYTYWVPLVCVRPPRVCCGSVGHSHR